jgi:ribosomal protein L37AE/L43A
MIVHRCPFCGTEQRLEYRANDKWYCANCDIFFPTVQVRRLEHEDIPSRPDAGEA